MLHIWDTTGQEMFKSINKMFYRGVNGVGLVFDLTCPNSFNSLDSWLNEFISSQGREDKDLHEFAFILIGNKMDIN
jgi:GTPase SAR1 family protein